MLAAPGEIPASYFIVEDEQGANDVVAQSDLSQLGRDDTDPNFYKLFWSWDEVDQWTGTGQTGDACALFDSDGDGKINVAVCAQITNFNADPTVVRQTTSGSPYVFKCGDTKNDRCAQPKGPQARVIPTQVTAGQVGSVSGGALNATANLITDTDPFDENDLNGPGDDFDLDSTIEIYIQKTFLNTLAQPATGFTVDLVNVCSYPSAGNGGNNNPFDCIVTPGAGFLKIVKLTPLNTSATFDFTVSPTPANGDASYSLTPVTDTDVNATKAQADSGAIVMSITSNASVTEGALPAGWAFTSVSCAVEGVAGTVGTPGNKTVTGVPINSGKITTCTFTNDPVQPKLTVTKTVTNDNGGDAVVSDFPLFIDGNAVTSGVKNTVTAGQHTVSETSQPGYTAGSWGGDCAAGGSITLAFGDDKTCTITNDDVAPTLTLIKSVTTDDGGDAQPDDFLLTIDGNAATSGTAYDVSANGTGHVIDETQLSGYTFVSITGDPECPAALGGTVTLDEGEDVTCTITNDDVAPSLSLRKVVINDNGLSNLASEWTLTATPTTGSAISGQGTQHATLNEATYGPNDASANVVYTLTESGPSGYSSTGVWTCVGGDMNSTTDTVTLAEGESATCSITNDDDKFDPAGTTVQHWILHDTISLTLRAGGGASTVTFELFDNEDCSADNGGLVGSETVDVVAGVAATVDGVLVSESGTYFWVASYSGNQNNNVFETECGDEITEILAKDDLPRDDFFVTLANFAEFG